MASIQTRQLKVIEQVLMTTDSKTLKQVEEVFLRTLQNSDLEDALDMALKQGNADAEVGRVVSHEYFMQALDEGLAEGNAQRIRS